MSRTTITTMAPPASAVAAAAQHIHASSAASRSPSPRKSNRRHQSSTSLNTHHQSYKGITSSASTTGSGASTPGLVALSPAMAAQVSAGSSSNAAAAIQGSPSSKTARRSKGNAATAQRRGVHQTHSEGAATTVSDSSNGRTIPHQQSRAEAFLLSLQGKHSNTAAKPATSVHTDEGMSLSDAPVLPVVTTLSSTKHKRATRRGKRQQESAHASQEQPDDPATSLDVNAVDRSLTAADLSDAQLVTPAKQRRSKRTRGQASKIASTTAPADLVLDDSASLYQLSKSAPASSFLDSAFPASITSNHAKQASDPPVAHSKKTKSSSNVPTISSTVHIHSSNSADEWDMPLVSKRNDALTWQQVGLSRKSSLGPHTQSKAHKKQASSAIANSAAGKPAAPSGLSTLLAQQLAADMNPSAASDIEGPASAPLSQTTSSIAASAQAKITKANAALTWQQELFRASAPSTPADLLFSALEEGHTGANPAKDYRSGAHTRMSSSPVKSGRIATNSASTDSRRLNNSLAALSLAGSKGTPQRKRASTSDGRTSDNAKGYSNSAIPRSQIRPFANANIAESDSGSSEDSIAETPAVPVQITGKTAGLNSAPSSDSRQASMLGKATPPLGSRPPDSLSKSPTKPVAISNSPSLYAGPRFHNSPSPGQLPTPRLAAMMNRNKAVATTAISETQPAF